MLSFTNMYIYTDTTAHRHNCTPTNAPLHTNPLSTQIQTCMHIHPQVHHEQVHTLKVLKYNTGTLKFFK